MLLGPFRVGSAVSVADGVDGVRQGVAASARSYTFADALIVDRSVVLLYCDLLACRRSVSLGRPRIFVLGAQVVASCPLGARILIPLLIPHMIPVGRIGEIEAIS